MQVGICSAATKGGFEKLVNAIVGPERLSKLDVVMAGDDVKAKKPDPMIYNVAREKIGIPADKYVHLYIAHVHCNPSLH
jgi:beta-phosphoglucomutase-like phosphatase (HAD superfamily)